jgi:hypothetical protein
MTMKSMGALLNAHRQMSRLDRDAICLAIESTFKRVVALEEAHNRDTRELREAHILARQNALEIKRLRERLERGDGE